MKILIYGAGGIGLYFATRLSQAGFQITLKGREATVSASHHAGLSLRQGKDLSITEDIRVVHDMAELEFAEFDAAIIATKAWQVAEVAAEIQKVMTQEATVLSPQNGITAPQQIAKSFPPANILASTVVVIVAKLAELEVELVGEEATMSVGSITGDRTKNADNLLQALNQSGIFASWNTDINSALWKKLALISSYGGIGALARSTVGETRKNPETSDLVQRAINEVFQVAQY